MAVCQCPASPSVSSMRVPAGSIRNAIFSPIARHVPEGDLEGDAVGRELLAERLQVFHFEADVVE